MNKGVGRAGIKKKRKKSLSFIPRSVEHMSTWRVTVSPTLLTQYCRINVVTSINDE